MRMLFAAMALFLSGCAVTGAVVSVASTAVGVAADVGSAAVKGTYKAGKAVASSLETKPEKVREPVRVVSSKTTVTAPPALPEPEVETASSAAEPKPKSKSRVDRLAGY